MRWKDIPDGILHTVIKYPVKNGMGEEASIICELAKANILHKRLNLLNWCIKKE